MQRLTDSAPAMLAALCLLAAACEQKNPEPRFVGKTTDGAAAPAPAPSPAAPPPPPVESAPAAGPADAANAGETTAAGLVWPVPEGWAIRPPTSQMRALEMLAPAAGEAGEQPEFVVLHFGPNGAGSVEDNLERWARQVTDEKGQAVVPEVAKFESAGLSIVTLATRGTYASGMPGGPVTPRNDFVLLAAIVENAPQGPVYVRFTGPAAAVEAQRGAFESLLRGARAVGP